MARADVARDRPGHDPDRPGPGDQHVLSHQVESERGMDRIAERIEDRAELVVDVVGQRHDVERRHPHIFGEGAGDVDADAARLRREDDRRVHVQQLHRLRQAVAAARRATSHADHVALARHPLADPEALHVRADFGDLARIFMPDRHRSRNRLPRPLVPVEDVHVGAADPGLVHLDQDVVGTDRRRRFVAQPKAGLRLFLDERFH